MLDWLGMVNMRIHRPSSRTVLTALKDCDPHETCMTARVRPWAGRMTPTSNRQRSVGACMTPVIRPDCLGLEPTTAWDQTHGRQAGRDGRGRSSGSVVV